MFVSRLTELAERLDSAAHAAAAAMGETAVSAVRAQMEQGYARPIRDTGALMRDVRFTQDGRTVTVGSTLPYAGFVHDGSSTIPARPYLTDGIMGAVSSLEEAAAEVLRQSV